MTKEEAAQLVRSIPACPGHQNQVVSCPDGNPGCAVLHYAPRQAVHSAACCNECAALIYKAIRPDAQ